MKLYSSILSIALLVSMQISCMQQTTTRIETKSQGNFVYLNHNVRDIVTSLYEALPEYTWSTTFKNVCKNINDDESIAEYAHAEAVVLESLALFRGQNCPELKEIEQELTKYLTQLYNGDAAIIVADEAAMTRGCCNTDCNSKCVKYKGTKAFCNLLAQDLQILGSGYIANLTTNNFRVTGNAIISGDLTVDGTIFTDESITFEDLVVDNLTVNGIFTTNGPVNMGIDATADDINIGTGGAGRIVNIGNDLAGSITTITGDTSQLVLGFPADSANLSATGAVNVDGTTTLDLNASAGPVNIANDDVTQTVNIATGTPLVKTVNIANGAGANVVNIANGAGAPVITTGSATAASITENALIQNYGTTGVAQTLNIGTGTPGIKTVHIADGAAANVVTVGSATATSITENALTMNYGNSTVAQTLNFGTGTPGAKTIHIGDGAAANVITVGSDTTTSITENAITMNYGNNAIAQTLNFGTGAAAKSINIGTGAALDTITIGNDTAGTAVSLIGGTGAGVAVSGTTNPTVDGAFTDTLINRVGQVSFTGLAISAALAVQFDITNSLATTNSRIIATLSATSTGGSTVIYHLNRTFVPADGTIRFIVQNIGTTNGPITDVLTFTFWVLNS